jgi:TolB protein
MLLIMLFIFCLPVPMVASQESNSLLAYALSIRCPFDTRRTCGGQIVLFNPQTGDTRLLESGFVGDSRTLNWSPQGDQLGFWRGNRIWLINVDGTNIHAITPRAYEYGSPVWSPDGQRIASTVGWNTQPPNLYVINVDGTQQTRLTNGMVVTAVFGWSPDGNRIYFFSRKCRICAINVDGTGFTDLSVNLGTSVASRWGNHWSPVAHLSPDGSQIAFVWNNEQIYVMDSNGGNIRQITPSDGKARGSPHWVLGGTHLIYYEDRPVSIYLVDLVTLDTTFVVGAPLIGGSNVSPDGQEVTYLRGSRDLAYVCITNLISLIERCYEDTHPYFDAPPQWQPQS